MQRVPTPVFPGKVVIETQEAVEGGPLKQSREASSWGTAQMSTESLSQQQKYCSDVESWKLVFQIRKIHPSLLDHHVVLILDVVDPGGSPFFWWWCLNVSPSGWIYILSLSWMHGCLWSAICPAVIHSSHGLSAIAFQPAHLTSLSLFCLKSFCGSVLSLGGVLSFRPLGATPLAGPHLKSPGLCHRDFHTTHLTPLLLSHSCSLLPQSSS